jgi:hypothetical protein
MVDSKYLGLLIKLNNRLSAVSSLSFSSSFSALDMEKSATSDEDISAEQPISKSTTKNEIITPKGGKLTTAKIKV